MFMIWRHLSRSIEDWLWYGCVLDHSGMWRDCLRPGCSILCVFVCTANMSDTNCFWMQNLIWWLFWFMCLNDLFSYGVFSRYCWSVSMVFLKGHVFPAYKSPGGQWKYDTMIRSLPSEICLKPGCCCFGIVFGWGKYLKLLFILLQYCLFWLRSPDITLVITSVPGVSGNA